MHSSCSTHNSFRVLGDRDGTEARDSTEDLGGIHGIQEDENEREDRDDSQVKEVRIVDD